MDAQTRNKAVLKNIGWSSVMRIASICINLILVPVLITFLGSDQYGVWLTISSLLGWSGLLDLGLGNGLKNSVARSLSQNDTYAARSFVSTGYAMLFIISTVLIGLFFVLDSAVNWMAFLNIDGITSAQFSAVLLVFFIGFSCKLFFGQIINVAAAYQFTALNDMINFGVNISVLLSVLFIFRSGDLLTVSWLYGVIPIALLILSSTYFFSGRLEFLRPSLQAIDFSKARELIGSGSQFFVIQIAGVIIFSTDNLIISHLMEPAEVTNYQVAFKYFGLATLLFSVICTPLWPAYTNAFHSSDLNWIKRTTRKLIRLWLSLVAAIIVMLLLASTVYDIWVGDAVRIPFLLSALMATYVLAMTWASIFVTFINSTGKLALQVRFSIAAGMLNIPLSYFFVQQLGMGPSGVILATIICLSYGPFVSIIQYRKLISGTASGIWAK
jgi:O-antigen/teichoic acid export membrane protein